MQLEIPIRPISVNRCWQGRRFKTPEYKKWRQDFALLLRLPRHFDQYLSKRQSEFTLHFYIKNYAKTDVDNLIKSIFDALKECGVIKDDRYIKRVIAEKFRVDKKSQEKIIIKMKYL